MSIFNSYKEIYPDGTFKLAEAKDPESGCRLLIYIVPEYIVNSYFGYSFINNKFPVETIIQYEEIDKRQVYVLEDNGIIMVQFSGGMSNLWFNSPKKRQLKLKGNNIFKCS